MISQRDYIRKLLAVVVMSLLLIILSTSHAMAAAALEDGEYTINYEILRGDTKDDSTSLADGYWDKPAKVIVKDGNITVQTTINQHAWVIAFATQSNGKMIDAKVVSTNEKANSRVAEFKVNSFDDLLLSSMTVDIPEIDYLHSYEARFKFYSDSMKLVAKAATTPTATPKPTAKPTSTPKVTPEPEPVAEPASEPTKETTTNTNTAEPSTSDKPKAPTEAVAITSPDNAGSNTASPDSDANTEKTDDIQVIDIGDIAAERENEGSSPEEDVDASLVLTMDDEFIVTAEGITANEALEGTTEVETDQFTVDIEEKQGGTIAITIIIIIAIMFIAGAIAWMVISRKRNK
ncbi:MAG TPA: NEAT domain-containing protein [Candidatus Paenibacillus intestinavium]|nr:NEAT domain-containing protein [Candidatus Paenibacillus intestinavium]